MLESDLIQSTSSWRFVEIRKLLKDRKEILNNKKKLFFKLGMDQAVYPILALLEKFQEHL